MANIQTTSKPVVVLGKDLLANLYELPKQTYRKFTNFLTKFEDNPRSSGINLERIANAADNKLHSVRIDQKYRAIIAYDKADGVYIVLHVDNHDDAYAWAMTKRIDVNQRTKAVQLYDVVSAEEQQAALRESQEQILKEQRKTTDTEHLSVPVADNVLNTVSKDEFQSGTQVRESVAARSDLDAVSERTVQSGPLPDTYRALEEEDLRNFGVPEMFVPIMKTRNTWEQFNYWKPKLSEDAAACLQFVASETITLGEESPNVGFRQALASYSSQQSFVVVQGEEDLKRLLDAPLEMWRVFLHPSQRIFVERNYHGPFRLLGAAGTGKTVVAMHRAKHSRLSLCAMAAGRRCCSPRIR